MRKTFFFRVYSPPETVVVPVEYERHLLPGAIEDRAKAFAQQQYIKKHKSPTVEIIKIVEEPLIKPVGGNGR